MRNALLFLQQTDGRNKTPRLSIDTSSIYWPGNYKQIKSAEGACVKKSPYTNECLKHAPRVLPPPSFKKKTHLKVAHLERLKMTFKIWRFCAAPRWWPSKARLLWTTCWSRPGDAATPALEWRPSKLRWSANTPTPPPVRLHENPQRFAFYFFKLFFLLFGYFCIFFCM